MNWQIDCRANLSISVHRFQTLFCTTANKMLSHLVQIQFGVTFSVFLSLSLFLIHSLTHSLTLLLSFTLSLSFTRHLFHCLWLCLSHGLVMFRIFQCNVCVCNEKSTSIPPTIQFQRYSFIQFLGFDLETEIHTHTLCIRVHIFIYLLGCSFYFLFVCCIPFHSHHIETTIIYTFKDCISFWLLCE